MRNVFMKKYTLLILFGMLFVLQVKAQSVSYSDSPGLLTNFSYAVNWTGGDLADRFGQHFSVGFGGEIITGKSNLLIGLQGQFIFGQKVRTDVLSNLRSPEGFIFGNDKNIADTQLRQRGFYVGASLGKIFPFNETNPRAGIKVQVSGGLWQHKIRIQDDPSRSVPQLEGDFKKGYDRLTNGLAFTPFVGYQLLSPDGRLNFFVGLEGMIGFTAGRRDFNFDTRTTDNESRVDFTYGLRVGWILPFYF